MASLTRSQLKTSSNNTYDTNGVGGITATEVRTFNDDLIDSLITNDLTGGMSVLSASFALTASSVNGQTLTSLNQYTASNDTKWSTLGGITGSFVTETESGSFLVTASVNLNTITFTKGNNTTFAVTVNTGSSATTDITALNSFTASQLTINTAIGASTSSLNTFTASAQTSINALNTFTASQSTASLVTSITNLNTFSASTLTRLTNIESTTASLLIETSNLETFSASALISINALNSATSSYVTETESGSFLITASVNLNTITFTKGNNTTFDITVNTGSGGATTDITALNSFTASQYVSNSYFATTASLNSYTQSTNIRLNNLETTSASVNVSISNLNSTTASQAVSITNLNAFTQSQETKDLTLASVTSSLNTSASLALVTASFSGNTLTFTKGDASTFGVVIPDVSGSGVPTGTISGSAQITALGFVSSSITASSIITASVNNDDITFTKGDGSQFTIQVATGSFAISASFAETASFALNGGVTQILAGPNIIVSPLSGKGQVTISSTGTGSGGFNTATGSYGSFYDTTIQTNPVVNSANSMSFNETAITNGVSISGSTNPFNTYIKTENAGVYNLQFSAQLDKTDSGTDSVDIWIRKNGIDLLDTGTTVTLTGNNDKSVAAWNWFVQSAANDYYQIIWSSADTDMRLLAEVSSSVHPGIPSVIATVNRVDQFLSNTGSFSGSFTGTFNGYNLTEFTTTSSFNSYTSSNDQKVNSLIAATGSYATTGSNTFVGSQIITGSMTSTQDITISGVKFGFGNPAGTSSIAIGFNSLANNTGTNNIAIGVSAGQLNTNGGFNVIIGQNAAVAISSGSSNTIIGYAAGAEVRGGSGNTFIGQTSGYNTSGSNNTFIGAYRGIGNESGVIALSDGGQNLKAIYNNGWVFTGSVDIQNTLTASLAQGFTYVGDANGRTTLVATSSFGGGATPTGTISSSAQITALGFVSSSVTASSLITASFSGNTLTFTKGNGTTFGVIIPDISGSTINTGSFATTGSNAFFGTNTFSGAVSFTGSAPSILSQSFSGSLITNLTDIYTDVAAVQQIVTLTSASYAALASGSLTNPNTLYIVSGSTSGSGGTTTDITSLNAFTASQYVSNSFFATTGSNSFNGNQRITGSLTISSSATNDLIVIGRQVITGSAGNPTARVTLDGTSVFIDTTRDDNTGALITAYASAGSQGASLTLGVYDTPNFNTDIELNINVDTGSGIVFKDFDNVSAFDYVPFMSVAPNLGNNPAPVMTRGLVVTGSVNITGQYLVNGVPISGSGGTIATGSFATTGSNQFKGNQSITGSLYTNNISTLTIGSTPSTLNNSTGTLLNFLYDDINFAASPSIGSIGVGWTMSGTGITDGTVTSAGYGDTGYEVNITSGNVVSGSSYIGTGPFVKGLVITGSVFSDGGFTTPVGLSISNQDGTGVPYGAITLNAAGLDPTDIDTSVFFDGGANLRRLILGLSSYTDMYGGQTVPTIQGGGNYNAGFGSSNVSMTFFSSSIQMWKPTQFKAPVQITGSLTISGSTTFVNNSGNTNIFLGPNTLTSNTTGIGNVGIGQSALQSNTTGNNNFAFGTNALAANIGGVSNFAAGADTGRFAKGDNNIYIGGGSGQYASGSNNTFIGSSAGMNITGSANTIMGAYTGTTGSILNNNIVLADGNGQVKAQYSGSAWSFQDGIKLNKGTDKPCDIVNVLNGNATVNNSLATTSSVILLTTQEAVGGGVWPAIVDNKTNGSFDIKTNQSNTVKVAYLIINPTA